MTVLDSAFNLVHANGGAKAVAPRIEKRPSSLNHELVGRGSAKFGLVDAVKVTQLYNDLRILNAFAAECGCLVLPMVELEAGEADDVMLSMADMAREFSELVANAIQAKADNKVTANELARLKRDWAELVSHGQRFISGMSKQHEAGKPVPVRKGRAK